MYSIELPNSSGAYAQTLKELISNVRYLYDNASLHNQQKYVRKLGISTLISIISHLEQNYFFLFRILFLVGKLRQ